MTVFDVAGRKEVKRIATGAAPVGILVEPSGKRAFVANTAADKVSVLDLATLEVVGTIAAGREPDGLALAAPK